MSKKSAYRRRRSALVEYTLTPEAWNCVRVLLEWPETGEPVPYSLCLGLDNHLASGEDTDLQALVALIIEGWQQSYPLPPQTVIISQ